jgi:hypothetical protein
MEPAPSQYRCDLDFLQRMGRLTSIGSSIGTLPYLWFRGDPYAGKWWSYKGFAIGSQALRGTEGD